MEAPLEVTLRDEVRRAAQAFARLLDFTSGLAPELVASIRTTAEETSRSGVEAHVLVALIGDSPAARRAVLNAALGEPLLGSAPQRDARVTIVRRAATFDYEGRLADVRRVVRFSTKMPDKRGAFDKRIAQADRELADASTARVELEARVKAARAAVAEVDAEIDRARRELSAAEEELARARDEVLAARAEHERSAAIVRRAPTMPSVYARTPPWWALWLWLWRLLLGVFLRDRLRQAAAREAESSRAAGAVLARASDEDTAERARRARDDAHRAALARLSERRAALAALEREHEDLGALASATARVEGLRHEREVYLAERRALFAAGLRAFDLARARGEELAELTIDYPAKHLPDGLTLVDLPSPASEAGRAVAESTARRDADAFVLVADASRPPSAATASLVDALARSVLRLRLPPATGGAPPDGAFFTALAAERTLVTATRAAMRMRNCVAELARSRAAAEESHRKRLEALERQRIPHPTEFRATQVARMQSAIDTAADAVLALAMDLVRALIAAVQAEWTERIATATSRASIEAATRAIDETAAARIAEVMERTSEHVARELQTHAESLETWALEEIHARYQVARRFGAEELSPVASELTREDLEREVLAGPVSGAMDTFEKQRVGYGLGGVAAGAVIGTLILPGIGTAIGAFVGVFAGFLKGTDSLKEDCLSKIEASLRETEGHALAQLKSKRPDLARVLLVSVDDALREALDRLDKAISRLMDVERRAIDGERAKLDELRAARDALGDHDARLAKLVDAATLRLAAATGG